MSALSENQSTVLPAIDAGELLERRDAIVIDLRSPTEHADDHIPRARNLPLFEDDQRALVGTLYRRVSPAAAFTEARRIVRERVRELVRRIAEAAEWEPPETDLEARVLAMTSGGIERFQAELACAPARAGGARPVVFHCWRGGLRSQSVATLVRALGLERTHVLAGGYKAYRAQVVRELGAAELPAPFVLRGLTGVGKTLVLHEIERRRPGWTLDLEGCAEHRSSLLGMVGRRPCSQRMFESRIAARLRERGAQPLVLEGESRKVGDVTLPQRVWTALERGTCIELTASVERRIEVLCDDYLALPENRAELLHRLPSIEARLPKRVHGVSLTAMLERGEEGALVRLLLEHYYDPLYRHSQSGYRCAITIDATDPARAAADAIAFVENAG